MTMTQQVTAESPVRAKGICDPCAIGDLPDIEEQYAAVKAVDNGVGAWTRGDKTPEEAIAQAEARNSNPQVCAAIGSCIRRQFAPDKAWCLDSNFPGVR